MDADLNQSGGFRLFEDSTTQCFLFPELFDRLTVFQFDQVEGSSDGGAIMLQAAERRLGIIAALADCMQDDREAGKVRHEMEELLTQRVMAIACGYEDGNDAALLGFRSGP